VNANCFHNLLSLRFHFEYIVFIKCNLVFYCYLTSNISQIWKMHSAHGKPYPHAQDRHDKPSFLIYVVEKNAKSNFPRIGAQDKEKSIVI